MKNNFVFIGKIEFINMFFIDLSVQRDIQKSTRMWGNFAWAEVVPSMAET